MELQLQMAFLPEELVVDFEEDRAMLSIMTTTEADIQAMAL